ncbi:ABC transporter substrate-binding protein, partial [Pseudomonas sp. MPR-R5A]
HNSEAGLEQLESAGIKVIIVNDAANFEEVYESIKMIGQATGASEEADELVNDLEEKLASIEKQAKAITEDERKSVFVEISGAPEIYSA